MKSLLFVSALVMVSVLLNAQSNLSKLIKENAGAVACSHTRQLMASASKNQQKSHAGQNIDIIYSRAEWYINPSVLYINGAVTYYFRVTDNQISQISLELDTSFTIDSVLFHNQLLAHIDSGAYLFNVSLPASLPFGTVDSLTIFYQGIPNGSGFGSFIKSAHGGVPIIWTLSEPYGAREWWPSKNDLSDKIDSMDILVTCPSAYRAASNGVLVNELLSGTNKVYHWKHRYPIATYLVAIAVTNYAVYSEFAQLQNSIVEVLNYVYPEDSTYAAQNTPTTITCLQLYSDLFTEYPFADEKYGHAQFGWGGGMEHQTMSFMGSFNHELISHELAHQWFGDMVTLGSWQDIWLNEGFATYLTGLTYENMPGTPYWENWKQGKISHITSFPHGSVFCDDTSTVGRIFDGRLSYSKGAYVLHMLRWVIGDSAFFQGVRNYLNDPAIRHGYAKTDDLKYHLEQSSGKNLTEFLSDWYYGQGFPIYDFEITYNAGNNVQVVINQITSHSSVSFFEMPVPLRFTGPFLDTTIIFDHISSGQVFNVSLSSYPDHVDFDPESHIVAQSTISTNVGMKQIAGSNGIKVYPNPAEDVLKIDLMKADKLVYYIYSVDGELIMTGESNSKQIVLPVEKLSAGVYFLKAVLPADILNYRFIKQ